MITTTLNKFQLQQTKISFDAGMSPSASAWEINAHSWKMFPQNKFNKNRQKMKKFKSFYRIEKKKKKTHTHT
jgi:hypothetical protein